MQFIRILGILLGPIGVFLVVYGYGLTKIASDEMPGMLQKQYDVLADKEEEKVTFFQKRLRPLANWFADKFPDLRSVIMPQNLEVKLLHAGRPFDLSVDEGYGMQWVGAAVAAVAGLYFGILLMGFGGAIAAAIVLGAGGFFLFPLWLDSEADDRQREISVDMMETLDILAISVKAGMGFDDALSSFVHNIEGPLGEELKTYLQEISVGVTREEALSNIVYRNSSQDLRTFVGAMIQGYQLGTPLADVLQKQAEEMRVRQLQLARELGAKAAPKIALVTGLLMTPAIACLIITIFGFELASKMGPALSIFGGGSSLLP